MKKKIFAMAVMLICISILASTTLAYFTDVETARNVITSDGIDIVIEEWQETPAGLIPYPSQPIMVMPGINVSKIVTVRNQDAQSFIRAKLDLTLTDAAGKKLEITPEITEKIIHLVMNTADWTEKDGWWYYGKAVSTGAATTPLMTGVSFDGLNMTNEYQNCTLEIYVYAQAVQAANNGNAVMEAVGWPEEE